MDDEFFIQATDKTPDELAREFERDFFGDALESAHTTDEPFTSWVSLEQFIIDRLTPQWREEEGEYYEGIDEFLEYMTGSAPERILEWVTEGSGPPSWYWYVGSFRIVDRGYLYVWNEPDVETGQPTLVSWRPYEDDHAFAKAFIELYRDDAKYVVVNIANRHSRGERLSREVLEEALLVSGHLAPTTTPLDQHRGIVREFLDRSERHG